MLNICEQSDSQRDWGLDICEHPERLKTANLWAASWGRPIWCWPSATGLVYCWSLNMIQTEDWTFVSSPKDWILNIYEQPERLKIEYLWAATNTEDLIFVSSQTVRETEDWIFVSGHKYWRLDICKQSYCQRDWRLNICERPERLKTEYLWAATNTEDLIFVSSQTVRETEDWIFVSGQKD